MWPPDRAPSHQLSRARVQSGSAEEVPRSRGPSQEETFATKVLKTIASKSGLEVTKIVNTIDKPEGSTAQGKYTTKQHKVIEAWDFDQLVSVAGILREAIAIFRDKTRTADQEEWLQKRKPPQKRKRP